MSTDEYGVGDLGDMSRSMVEDQSQMRIMAAQLVVCRSRW